MGESISPIFFLLTFEAGEGSGEEAQARYAGRLRMHRGEEAQARYAGRLRIHVQHTPDEGVEGGCEYVYI